MERSPAHQLIVERVNAGVCLGRFSLSYRPKEIIRHSMQEEGCVPIARAEMAPELHESGARTTKLLGWSIPDTGFKTYPDTVKSKKWLIP